jgi:hypothetical protein
MRSSLVEDRFGRSEVGQHLEDAPDTRFVFDPRVQLAVAEGASAAFAKAVVAVLVEPPARAQVGERLAPRSYRFPAVDHDRAQTCLDQLKRSEGPRRTRSDHQHRRAGCPFRVGSPARKGFCAGSVLDTQTPSRLAPAAQIKAHFEQPDGATATWVSGGLEELVSSPEGGRH